MGMRRVYPQGLLAALRHAARFCQYEPEILDAVDEIERLEAEVTRRQESYVHVLRQREDQNAEIKRLRALLTDARRVIDWGEPEPKPVLRRIEAALNMEGK